MTSEKKTPAAKVKALRDFVKKIEFQLHGRPNGIHLQFCEELSEEASQLLGKGRHERLNPVKRTTSKKE